MQSEFLESAEFYNRRYHNFSSYVIFPSFILFLFLIIFSIFAQKEISLTAGATVEPARIIATIQSSSNSKIVANHWLKISLSSKGIFSFNTKREQKQFRQKIMLVSWKCSRIRRFNWSIKDKPSSRK